MKEPTRYTKGKNVYVIGSWHVDKSLEVFVWLTKTFGEGFVSIFMSPEKGEAVGKVFDGGSVEGDDMAAIEEFVSKIVNRLEPKEYTSYARLIVQGTRVNGHEIDFNTHFSGRIGELHGVLFQILRHQYGDFLGESESED
jgi:hypothetical protein